jgi:hypothetical protein
MSIEDVIDPSWLETYKRQQKVLWEQLINLNCYIFLIEKIEAFPFDVFLPLYDDRIFWRLAKNSMIETSLMIVWRIAVDTGGDSLTLNRFKNEIFQHLRDDQTKKDLGARIRNDGFEIKITGLKEKVNHARHNYLAHLNREAHITPDERRIAQNAVSLNELRSLRDALRDLFDVLGFEHLYVLWPWGYLDGQRQRQSTDIDRLLDGIAKESYLLNMPEYNPEVWEMKSLNLSQRELGIINDYRPKFGLSPMPQSVQAT